MLKHVMSKEIQELKEEQPPSGGCVLKHYLAPIYKKHLVAATFGWLCVETLNSVPFRVIPLSSHLRVAVC